MKTSIKAALGYLREDRNNLGSPNTFYKVTAPFPVWVLTGHKPSNHWYGAAQLQEPIYKQLTAKVGDEVHNLHGGVFFVRDGKGWDAKPEQPKQYSPFEKTYGGSHDAWPLKSLQQIKTGMRAKYGHDQHKSVPAEMSQTDTYQYLRGPLLQALKKMDKNMFSGEGEGVWETQAPWGKWDDAIYAIGYENGHLFMDVSVEGEPIFVSGKLVGAKEPFQLTGDVGKDAPAAKAAIANGIKTMQRQYKK